ncbi:hypothetical protein [Pantoea cypripedii]|uniref:hypothetical protein n=1 Tax=Pantoea cypripedii TaxID=55209 RepID=UPI00111C8A22|nr:hypothetical protein [Pantoea cypripedii]MBP2197188.1 hypothetical protein [Pantoea cypripedii]
MADISNGPVSSLPGNTKAAPSNTKCDDHPERDAVKRVQGETDSFGCEYLDMCQECYQAHIEESKNSDRSGCCDWCRKHADQLYPHRDIEEGSSGRVYDVCLPCIDKERKSWREEDEDYA